MYVFFDHVAVHDILESDFDKLIQEKDLIKIGFKKEVVTEEDGRSDEHYYTYNLLDDKYSDLCLLVTKVEYDQWVATLFPYNQTYTHGQR